MLSGATLALRTALIPYSCCGHSVEMVNNDPEFCAVITKTSHSRRDYKPAVPFTPPADVKKSVRPLNEQWLSQRSAHLKSMLTLRLFNNPPRQAVSTPEAAFFSIRNITLKLRRANGTRTYQDLACQLVGSLGTGGHL